MLLVLIALTVCIYYLAFSICEKFIHQHKNNSLDRIDRINCRFKMNLWLTSQTASWGNILIDTVSFKFCYHTVIMRLPCNYHTVIIQLSNSYHTAVIQLSYSYLTAIIQLSYSYHTVILQPSYSYHTAIEQSSLHWSYFKTRNMVFICLPSSMLFIV